MTVCEFPTPGMARRFARNVRSRGMATKVDGRRVTVSAAGSQLALLVKNYAGLRLGVRDEKQTTR